MKFVDKQLAIKLKEKGFDRPCFGWYNPIQDELQLYCANNKDVTYKNILTSIYKNKVLVDAPTIDQVLEWLREEKKIIVTIGIYTNVVKSKYVIKIIKIVDKDSLTEHFIKGRVEKFFDNYDDTILAGIKFVVNDLI